MPLDARELFARMIRCEAENQGDIGQKAVATVIMNRVNVPYGEYFRLDQGDLRKVLLQPYQFTCAMTAVNGTENPQNVYNLTPTQEHYAIADWALSGNKLWNIPLSLWYYNPFAAECETYFPRNGNGIINTRILEHCFYNPTEQYKET